MLGPIRACDPEGRDVTPDGTLQRRLLALLVLRRGRVVSADAAVETLWPSRRPSEPFAALQNHVYRLRRTVPDGVIESVGEGYRLEPRLVDLDADRLADAVTPDSFSETSFDEVDALLARWHGPAYPELEDIDEGRVEAARLDELRVRARERRAEQLLRRGTTAGLVAELAAVADEQPLRERPRALLMTALAAAGRHVEALRVYDDFRRLLGDELGIEPSPELAAQHRALLAGTGTAAWTPANRLPVPRTSLVGRRELVDDVAALTQRRRLVTLVGPGGVGKTRALIEVGHRLRAACPDRPVVFCELAKADVETTADAVAAALGIDARAGVSLTRRIADVLGDTHAVLLLDNCEHVLDSAAELVERVLAGCPGVNIVATSRERLRVTGEQVTTVPTLPLGGADAPAVQLFVERAHLVAPTFEPDDAERACIAEIVRRLDGLPLAIELAAARLHTHEVGEIANGLDRRFALLTAGSRTSDRHGSLAAAVAWSFDLLDGHLQQVFADLSVFAGSFTAADAAAVAALDVTEATGTLAQLTERSLVMRAPDRRYVLLETLREFGAKQLAAAGRTAAVAERHARHQVDWIERADRRLLDSHEPVLAEIDAAIPELRAALGWMLAHGEIELAGRLIAGLLDYGVMRLRPDVMAWGERVLAADPDDRGPQAPLVWVAAAYVAWMSGDVLEAGARAARAIHVVERDGGEWPAEVAEIAGSHALFEGRLTDATRAYRRAAATAASRGDRAQWLLAATSELLALGYADDPDIVDRTQALLAEIGDNATPYTAYAWYCAGEAVLSIDVGLARSRFERAMHLADVSRASFVTGIAGASKASIDARVGDPMAAAADYRWLVTHWKRAGMWSTQWTMLRSIAGLLDRLGRHRDAAVLEGAVRATHAGHRIFGADEVALDELGARLRQALGNDAYDAAREEGAVLDGDAALEHALRAL